MISIKITRARKSFKYKDLIIIMLRKRKPCHHHLHEQSVKGHDSYDLFKNKTKSVAFAVELLNACELKAN